MPNQSFHSFQLADELLKSLELQGFQKPTAVQQEVIPEILNGKDLVVQAETGSGKTAAFGIPICEKIRWEENKPQALILTPTRELAAQIKDDLIQIGRFKRIKAAAIFGKQSFERQKNELKQKTHIVVGTPGRVIDHIKKGTLPISEIQMLILDEADEMFSRGFYDQIKEIMEYLPQKRQTMLFSATYPEKLDLITQMYLCEPAHIRISQTVLHVPKINESIITVHSHSRMNDLFDVCVVTNPDRCMLFANTIKQVDNIYSYLNKKGIPVQRLHGELRQEQRLSVINRFKEGAFTYLVATDVAGRGIDVADVSLIINVDVPEDPENYVHRIGRTARAGKTGRAIMLASSEEEKYVNAIEQFTERSIQIVDAPSREKVSQLKSSFLKKISEPQPLQIIRKNKVNKNITKIYINGGKKKKLRAVDFVGAITSINGVEADDIGIISIEYSATYIDILNGKGQLVIDGLRNKTIKGKQLKVHQARE